MSNTEKGLATMDAKMQALLTRHATQNEITVDVGFAAEKSWQGSKGEWEALPQNLRVRKFRKDKDGADVEVLKYKPVIPMIGGARTDQAYVTFSRAGSILDLEGNETQGALMKAEAEARLQIAEAVREAHPDMHVFVPQPKVQRRERVPNNVTVTK